MKDISKVLRYFFKWFALITPMAVAVGTVVALFLWALDIATETRHTNMWIILLLPFSGIFIVWLYEFFGKETLAGNNLILDRIHEPGAGRVPLRMAPLVLGTTVLTHLFGGSAGREGTAIQIGGSIASRLGKALKLSKREVRIFLMAGVAAGFGAVFGTPIAGIIFALEVVTVGRPRMEALLPCLLASIIADRVCIGWGIEHTMYSFNTLSEVAAHGPSFHMSITQLIGVSIAGILFGLAARFFSYCAHGFVKVFKKIENVYLRPVVGGVIVLLISLILGTTDYLGLGVSSPNPDGVSILGAFDGNVSYLSWFWKILLTTITLGCGFKGGEVTPLFFVGATTGAALGLLTGMPVDLLAAIGFVAVFGGATNTPIACTIMGIELFGSQYAPFMAVGCFVAFLFSGKDGIYSSQSVFIDKGEEKPERKSKQKSNNSKDDTED